MSARASSSAAKQGAEDVALDVLCAGEALFDLFTPPGVSFAAATSLAMAPGGAAVNVALALTRLGLRAGLLAMVGQDALGEALIEKLARAGVDTRFVTRGPARTGVLFIERGAKERRFVAYRNEAEVAPQPPKYARARAILLTGLLPSPAQHTALCAAARAARARGALVLVDLNARPGRWAGRNSEAPSALAVARAADVVKASADDLATLGLDAAALRATMRRGAALVVTHGAEPAQAFGAFGALSIATRPLRAPDPTGAGDAFTAGLLAELLDAGEERLRDAQVFQRAIARGHSMARELLKKPRKAQ